MADNRPNVLILGSAPSAIAARDWSRQGFSHIVAINNAWRIRSDWDYLIHPEDFPVENRPTDLRRGQRIITAEDYVPLQNQFGGFVYAGGTMAFTAGYWALAALRPAVIAFFGCDMVYANKGQTHFYGKGTADPLRRDVTLRSLEAKSARLALFGAEQNCRVVRLSAGESRLVLPSVPVEDLSSAAMPCTNAMHLPLAREAECGYFEPSGRYWEVEHKFDPARIDAIDRLWLDAYDRSGMARVA
ncbi:MULTISPECIES: hypothetical protein [unclassified Ruegeria]|uniref:hypothetical protein n=1 Tax=unclassified Ruegeria TaxID=2625375 RepID=UPI0014894290|nr:MULTISPECIES: hypothetical protein [unclassified Ruegeria]